MNPIKRHILYPLASLSLLMLAGCSQTAVKTDNLSEAEACERLEGLIADHDNQFKNYKKNFTLHRSSKSWSTVNALPNATHCQIWEWSSNLTNYYCEWKNNGDESQAKATYQRGVDIIRQCLSDEWTAKVTQTTSGGEHTLFSKNGGPTVVSMRYFPEKRSWFENWTSTLLIGDRNNLRAPTQ